MQLNTVELIATPCDEEEDNMALLGCQDLSNGNMFLMTRFPDEDEVAIALDVEEEPYLLRDLKITLGAERLLIEVSPQHKEALHGSDFLEIFHSTDPADLPEVLETLRNLLDGTGTLVSELA